MAKKRTKNQKQHAQNERVNSQIKYGFNTPHNFGSQNDNPAITDKTANMASIKKELYKSLAIAVLILAALLVLYWVS